ncbi:MAG: hypothetical protein AAF551_11000, partial [Bacteroidota bacterium]
MSLMRLLTIPLLFSLVYVHAQGNQAQYLNGKKYFAEGSYRDAMGSFQNLTDDREFGAYATFYYALSAYQQGLPKVALDTWKQAAIKFPTWDQAKEVDYWIAKVSIEQKKYLEGVRYMKRLPEDQANKLITSILDKIDLPALKEAFSENDSNKDLALLYFKALSHQPFEQQDQTMILNLSSRFGFKVDNVVEDYSIVKKKHYAVALVLPFLFDSLQNPQSVIRNSIIYEMYQGMLLGRDSLESKGVSLRLFPYDTYKRKDKAQRLVSRGVLDKADVIIGPLYSGPNEVISAYSIKKEIPMINPLSANQDVISDNSYAYLFKPSYQTQGRMAGEYAKNKFQRNKKAIVLFETERDKLVAQAYHETIKDDFDIVLYDQLTQENALKMQLDFTEQYEHSLDSLTKSQIDSISDLPGRFIRSRVKRDEQTGSVIRNDKGEEVRSYYEMKFKIPKDTIGHIFAATSSNLLANNLISLTEVRGDSIGII